MTALSCLCRAASVAASASVGGHTMQMQWSQTRVHRGCLTTYNAIDTMPSPHRMESSCHTVLSDRAAALPAAWHGMCSTAAGRVTAVCAKLVARTAPSTWLCVPQATVSAIHSLDRSPPVYLPICCSIGFVLPTTDAMIQTRAHTQNVHRSDHRKAAGIRGARYRTTN